MLAGRTLNIEKKNGMALLYDNRLQIKVIGFRHVLPMTKNNIAKFRHNPVEIDLSEASMVIHPCIVTLVVQKRPRTTNTDDINIRF